MLSLLLLTVISALHLQYFARLTRVLAIVDSRPSKIAAPVMEMMAQYKPEALTAIKDSLSRPIDFRDTITPLC
jgi:hypothetical protein